MAFYRRLGELLLAAGTITPEELDRGLELQKDYKVFAQSLTGRCLPDHDPLPPGGIDFAIRPEVFDCVERVR